MWNDGWHAFYSRLEGGAAPGRCGAFADPDWRAVNCSETRAYMCRYTESKSRREGVVVL